MPTEKLVDNPNASIENVYANTSSRVLQLIVYYTSVLRGSFLVRVSTSISECLCLGYLLSGTDHDRILGTWLNMISLEVSFVKV